MHVEILNFSTPRGQEEFVTKIQQMKIFHEGPVRSGYIRPIVSEWRAYDIRLPEDKVQEFAMRADINPISLNGPMSADNILSNGRIIRWGIKLMRFFLRLGSIDKAEGKAIKYHNWQYPFLIGTVKDPKQNTGVNNQMREVL